MPVHVSALGVATVIAGNDAIWIDDRHHPKFKLLSQFVGLGVLRYEEIEEAMDDEGGVCLTGMLSPKDQNDWLVIVFALLVLVCYLEYWDVNSSIRCSHRFKSDKLVVYTTKQDSKINQNNHLNNS